MVSKNTKGSYGKSLPQKLQKSNRICQNLTKIKYKVNSGALIYKIRLTSDSAVYYNYTLYKGL